MSKSDRTVGINIKLINRQSKQMRYDKQYVSSNLITHAFSKHPILGAGAMDHAKKR